MGTTSGSGRMAGFIKTTTGLTGLAVDINAPTRLKTLYSGILKACASMPQGYAYRRHTEQLVSERLNVVNTETDVLKVENKINAGQIEELVLQAERELALAKNMLAWKAWEPLVGEAPKNQWKWPV